MLKCGSDYPTDSIIFAELLKSGAEYPESSIIFAASSSLLLISLVITSKNALYVAHKTLSNALYVAHKTPSKVFGIAYWAVTYNPWKE